MAAVRVAPYGRFLASHWVRMRTDGQEQTSDLLPESSHSARIRRYATGNASIGERPPAPPTFNTMATAMSPEIKVRRLLCATLILCDAE